MCVLLCLTLMLVINEPNLEDPLVLLIVIIICFISNTTNSTKRLIALYWSSREVLFALHEAHAIRKLHVAQWP